MDIKSKSHQYKLNDNNTTYIKRYECSPCDQDSLEGCSHKMELMKTIVNNYNSLDSISKSWSKLTIKHNGTNWQLILETIIEENNV